MKIETYEDICKHADQFISYRYNTFGLIIALMYGNEAIEEIIAIARQAGHKVSKRIIGKGTEDAEVHLTIR